MHILSEAEIGKYCSVEVDHVAITIAHRPTSSQAYYSAEIDTPEELDKLIKYLQSVQTWWKPKKE
jgi:hypothetical protein